MLFNYNDNDQKIIVDKVGGKELSGWRGYGSSWGWDGPGRGQTSEAGLCCLNPNGSRLKTEYSA